MIQLTRLNGLKVMVNAELVEFLESTPETIVSMSTGRKVVVKETVEEVVRLVEEYHRRPRPVIKAAPN